MRGQPMSGCPEIYFFCVRLFTPEYGFTVLFVAWRRTPGTSRVTLLQVKWPSPKLPLRQAA